MEQLSASSEGLFTWIWLPGCQTPVVAGCLSVRADGSVGFVYEASYLARAEALPVYQPELPLGSAELIPDASTIIASCIRDAAPDAWGRRAMAGHFTGHTVPEAGLMPAGAVANESV